MATFPEWLEEHLGTMADGKETGLTAGTARVSVCRFPDQPVEGATTYATVGLSKMWLHAGERHVRQELLLSRWDDEGYDCARLLPALVEQVTESGDAIVHGAVLGPAGPLLPGATTEGFLAWVPAYHDESFVRYDGDEGHPPIEMTWLVPITADEAACVRQHGAGRLVREFEERDPDLLDWSRPSSPSCEGPSGSAASPA